MQPDASSVLVILIPEAEEAVVGEIRRAHDPSARDGMPAHVTVLTPFAPLSGWDAVQATRLRRAVEGIRPFRARFHALGRFGTTTLFLIPEPEATFATLVSRVAGAFPEWPPYGGAFSTVRPHLTLAHGVTESVLTALETRTRGTVDVHSEVSRLTLFSRAQDGRWLEGPHVTLDRD